MCKIALEEKVFTKNDVKLLIKHVSTYKDYLNPDSLKVIMAMIEPAVNNAKISEKYQFERIGYFSVDKDSTPQNLVFNRVVPLKDSWSKVEKVK